MADDDRENNKEMPLDEVRLALVEILRILQQDSGGYESQRSQIRDLAQRCLDVVEKGQR